MFSRRFGSSHVTIAKLYMQFDSRSTVGNYSLWAEPAPLAGTPPSASRFAPMLSGGAPTIGAAKERLARNM
jgi:hypothetical protein